MRRSQQRICLGYWYLCAAGVLAVCIGFGSATTLRSKKSNGVAPSPAVVSDGQAAVATPPVQIASGKAVLKPVVKLPSARSAAKTDQATRLRLTKAYGKSPLSFEANQGQTDPRVKFFSRGQGYSLFLTGDEAVLALRSTSQKSRVESRKEERVAQHSPSRAAALARSFRSGRWQRTTDNGPRTTDAFLAPLIQNPLGGPESRVPNRESRAPEVVRLKLAGADCSAKVAAVDELPGKSNYFRGNDPQRWRTNVPSYGKVRYEQVYRGIDLLYYGNQRQLEYDFVVSPGGDPSAIALNIDGADKMEIDGQGDLVLHAGGGEVRLRKPVVYQPTADSALRTLGIPKSEIQNRQFLSARYALVGKSQVAFEVASYDKSLPLVIDPTLSYSTFLGGSDEDELLRMAVDSDGNAYVVGGTMSLDFPLQNAYQSTNNGSPDVFVAKLDPTGTTLSYSTYLGGTGSDVGYGIAVDASNNAYLTGYTVSSDFPVMPTPGAYQTSLLGNTAAFVTKLDSSGAPVYSTFLGGSTDAYGEAIAVDSSKQAYVVGNTYSSDFPTTTSAYDRTCGTDGSCDGWYDTFVTKLNSSGSDLLYSTFLGGNDEDYPCDLALDSSGNVYVTGYTYSTNFPTKSAYDSSCGTDTSGQCNYDGTYVYDDAFVAKIDPSQTGAASLVYSTYLGGSGNDEGYGLAVDTSGNAYVTGYTDSTDFPYTSGAYQTSLRGYYNAFITKLNLSGSARVYSTYLGGTLRDWGMSIAVDSSGNAYVLGGTYSSDFPTTPNALQAANAGYLDLFVTRLNPAGFGLDYSTYFGGGMSDYGQSIVLGPSGSVYVAGYTYSSNFPTQSALDPTCGTDVSGLCNFDSYDYYADGFVAKIVPLPLEASVAPSSLSFSTVVGLTSASQAVTFSNIGEEVVTISDVAITGPEAGDFDQSGCTDGSVPAGSSCTINVTFTPTATGTRTATLTITHNAPAPGSTADVSLSGAGANFSVDAASGSSIEQTVAAGSTATYNLTITPNGFSGTASLSCTWVSTQPRGTSCAVLPGTVTLSGTTPQNATVRVTTTKGSMVGPSLRLPPPGVGSRLMVPWFLWLAGLGMLAMLAAGSRGNQRVWLRRATPFGALLFFILLWSACGGGGGGGGGTTPTGTPAGTYTLKVTATAGGVSRDVTLTLHVTAQ
jgi:hypothetical protein